MTRVIRAMSTFALCWPSVLIAAPVPATSTLLASSQHPSLSATALAPTPASSATLGEVAPSASPDVRPSRDSGPVPKDDAAGDLVRHLRVLPGLTGTTVAVSGAPAMAVAPEIVVTASRMREPSSQVAGAVTVVSRADAAVNEPDDLGDAISRAPSVDVPRYGGPGATSGITIRGGRAAQVLVMQDGRPLNSIATGEANPSVVPFAAVDRVEIVRGPSGMLYGSSAVGGVVNMLTPAPPSSFSGELAGEGGTFGTVSRRISLGGPIGPVRVLGLESRTTSDGARPNSAYRGENLFAKAVAFDNPHLEFSGGSWGSNLGVPGSQPSGDPALRTPGQVQYGNADVSSLTDNQTDRRRFADGKITLKPFEGHEAAIHSYAEVNETIFRWGNFWYDSSFNATPQISHFITGVQAEGVEGQYAAPPPMLPDSRIMVGGGWRKERLNANTQNEDLGGGPVALVAGMRGRVEVGSAFTEWTIVPGRGLPVIGGMTLEGGARLDRHSIFGNITNSHAGATLDLGQVALRVAAGTAFRAPTLSDLFDPMGGNQQLKPERAQSIEGGIEHRMDWTILRIGMFQRDVRDQIDWAPDATGLWQPHNIGRVTTVGDEFEGSSRWGRFSASGNVTVLKAVQQQEEVAAYDPVTYAPIQVMRERFPAHVPRYTAGAMVGAELPRGVSVTLAMRASGERAMYEPDPVTGGDPWVTKRLKPFALGTLRVTRKMGKGVELWAGIENLTDVRYAAHFGNDSFDQNYPMPGRTYFAGASATW